jgi:hypothetical protein
MLPTSFEQAMGTCTSLQHGYKLYFIDAHTREILSQIQDVVVRTKSGPSNLGLSLGIRVKTGCLTVKQRAASQGPPNSNCYASGEGMSPEPVPELSPPTAR